MNGDFKKEVKEIERLIKEDNVEELSKILYSNENLRNNFNKLNHNSIIPCYPFPDFVYKILLHFAVKQRCLKVVEYLLSQDFVDKSICNTKEENIYYIICLMKGEEELFSIIERKVPHKLILSKILDTKTNLFHLVCEKNTLFIVNRIYEILESLQIDLTTIKKSIMNYGIKNQDFEVIKYLLSIDGIRVNGDLLFQAIGFCNFEIIVYLLNIYLNQFVNRKKISQKTISLRSAYHHFHSLIAIKPHQ